MHAAHSDAVVGEVRQPAEQGDVVAGGDTGIAARAYLHLPRTRSAQRHRCQIAEDLPERPGCADRDVHHREDLRSEPERMPDVGADTGLDEAVAGLLREVQHAHAGQRRAELIAERGIGDPHDKAQLGCDLGGDQRRLKIVEIDVMAGDQRHRSCDRRLPQRVPRMCRVGQDGDPPPLKAAAQRTDVASLDDDDGHPRGVELLGDPETQLVQPADDDMPGDDLAERMAGHDPHHTSAWTLDPAVLAAVCRPCARLRSDPTVRTSTVRTGGWLHRRSPSGHTAWRRRTESVAPA